MIFMISVSIMCFGFAQIDTENIIFSLIQDLLIVVVLGTIFYVWIVIGIIQPDESFPTFKKWGRGLNPFKKKKAKKGRKN